MALADVGREPPSLFARNKVNVTVAPTPLMPTNVMTAQRQGNATVAPVVPRQMPAAIAALERAVHDEEEARRRAEAEAAAEGRALPPAKGVGLRQRVWPLVDMLRRAHAADKDIVWGV